MIITFLGYGSMAEALASRWVGAHRIVVAGRDADKAAALAERLGRGAEATDAAGAVRQADVVVLATRYEAVFDAIEAAGGAGAFAGRVVIDINNPVDVASGDFLARTFDGGRSLLEKIQDALPDARVVKAFNTCQAAVWTMEPPVFDGRPLVVPIAGNDDAAKEAVSSLVAEIGAEAVDCGDARHGRHLEGIAGAVIRLLFSGRDPRTVFNLIQPERRPTGI